MTTWTQVHNRNIALISKLSIRTLEHVVNSISQEEATTYRDGGDGWTVNQVVGHILDMDRGFMNRAKMMLAQDNPDLPALDHEQLVKEGDYNNRDKNEIMTTLIEHRAQYVELFQSLTDEQWERSGTHPERDYPFTFTDALMQVVLHDNNHLEQITRILAERKS